MSTILRFGLIGVAMVGMTGCMMGEGSPAGGSDPTTASATEGLTITQETETLLSGSYTQGDSLVTFEERLATPILTTKLVINGAEFTYVRDLVKSTVSIESHGNTILAPDAEVLLKLDKAFDSAGAGTQPKMREAMYKTIAVMAMAPRGSTFINRIFAASAPKLEVDRSYCDNDENYFICASNNLGGCGYTAGGYNGANPIMNANGTAGTEGGNQQYGGYVTGCTSTPTYTHEHEACEYSHDGSGIDGLSSSHGRVTWGKRIGWSAKACQGRCGAGCPRNWNFYIAKDCLDHDACLDNHPSSSSTSTFGTCGNEFDRAATDTATWSSDSYTSACGAMWGDNTR